VTLHLADEQKWMKKASEEKKEKMKNDEEAAWAGSLRLE
jgi:hypothetical protein